MELSVFSISQLLVGVAIGFDLLSFQFKERRRIIACLVVSCLLVAIHFALLGYWTATGLGLLAALRFATSLLTTSKGLMAVFIGAALVVAVVTFHGILSILSCLGSIFGTISSFCRTDKRLRQLMLIATSLWLAHNCLAGSPTAILMEGLFICSNLVGYYRFYCRRAAKLSSPP
ncbi:MAG: YgjV family protein [Desulfobulbaceae bacterium]|nr:YgjV family protein [Desulfobulbaceae bacterium]